MRRSIFMAAGILALSVAGLLAAIGTPGSSAQAPPPRTSVPASGKVLVYVWVTDPARPRPSRSIGLNFWEGPAWRGWFTIHANRWRKIWLRPGIKICAVKKPFRITPRCQFVSSHGQQIVFTLAVVTKGPVVPPRTPPVPPTPPTPPPPVTPVVPKQGGVFATLNCVGGVQGGPFAVQATVNGILQPAFAIYCNQRVQVSVAEKGTIVPVCFLAGGLPLLCKQAVAGVRGVVFTLTPPVTPTFAEVWLHAVCSPGAQVGVVVYMNGFPRGSAETFICSTPKQVGLFPPGTVLQFCLQWPVGSTWSGGGPCLSIVIDGRGRVVLNLTVIFTTVVTTTQPPPGGTTTVVTTVTTGTTTSGRPVDPNP